MSLNDDLFPKTTFFGEKEKDKTRQMASNIPDMQSFNTRKRRNPDGGETTLQTKGGMPRVRTTHPEPEVLQDEVWSMFLPCSDYYTQGFPKKDVSHPMHTWPPKDSKGRAYVYARLSRTNTKIEKLGGFHHYPGNTNWMDTRPDWQRLENSVLSWVGLGGGRGFYEDPYQLHYIVEEKYYNTNEWYGDEWDKVPPIGPNPNMYGYDQPDLMQQATSIDRAGWKLPNGALSRDSFIGRMDIWPLHPTLHRDYSGCYPDMYNTTSLTDTRDTWLSMNGKPLFEADNMVSAGKKGDVIYTIDVDYGLMRVYPRVGYAYPPLMGFSIVTRNMAGTELNRVPVVFPGSIFWMVQAPYFNSSCTKAVGIWATDDRRFEYHGSDAHVYEIDIETGSVTDLGMVRDGARPSDYYSGIEGNYTATFSADYRGDDMVFGKLQCVTTAPRNSTYTLLLPDGNITSPNFYSVTETDTEIAAGVHEIVGHKSKANEWVAPLYADIRFGNYVFLELKDSGTAELYRVDDWNTSQSTGEQSANRTSYSGVTVYLGGVEKWRWNYRDSSANQSAPIDTVVLDDDPLPWLYYYFENSSQVSGVEQASVYSLDGKMLVSLRATEWRIYDDNDFTDVLLAGMIRNLYVDSEGASEIDMSKPLDYPGIAKYFASPYIHRT
jgi:hypothetical protein